MSQAPRESLREALQNTKMFVLLALRALKFWRRGTPVTSTGSLARFVEAQCKYVSQTTLYGYIKTRAGTRYTSLFEDDVFANSVNMAKWEIYLACLSDLAVYAAARTGARAGADELEMAALARHLVDCALDEEEAARERPQGFDDFREGFAVRVRAVRWSKAAEREAAFQGSLAALVKWAPVADELKVNDTEIVRNSLRFKWKDIRDQLDAVLDAGTVMADWRSRAVEEEGAGELAGEHGAGTERPARNG